MKRLLYLIVLLPFLSLGQSSDAALTTQANVIRNETSPGGNTKTRIADMFQGLIDSKVSLLSPSVTNWNTAFGWGNHASAGYLTSLSNGNGTTASGSAVDLGGTQSADVNIKSNGYNFYIGGDGSDFSEYADNVGISGKTQVRMGVQDATFSTNYSFFSSSFLAASGMTAGDGTTEDYISVGQKLYSPFTKGLFYWNYATGAGPSEPDLIFGVSANREFSFNLGSDATGDTYYRNSSGYFTRLAAGTNGHVLTLAGGIPSWAAPSGGGLTVGTSTITSGTNTRVLYNNSGLLGEYTVSGSGNVAMTTSPTFTTPILGTPTSGTLTNATGYLFNNLAAATGTATINNAANAQEWQWNTLGAGTGLLLSSSSTAAASNTNTLFRVNQTGANATSTQTTYGGYFSNTKTGTSSTNVGLHAVARGGTTNYAGTFDGIIGQYDGSGGNFNYMQVVSGSWRMRAANSFYVYTGNNPPFIVDTRKVTIGFSSGSGSGETQSLETNSGAWPSIPSTTELSDIIFNTNGATWTWDAGTTTTQRFNWFKGHTVNGGTLTNAYQLYVDAPIVGTGTITNNYAAGFGGNTLTTGNATINGSLTVGSSYTTQGQIIQNVGFTGSDVYRRKVEWTPVTASGSSGNFDFNIFNTDVIQNSTCTVTITVTGVNSSGVKSYAKEMKATFRKPGTSDPVQVGSTTDIYEHSNDLTTPTSSVSASTDYCRVSYDSGTGAPTLQWTVFIETKYSTN